MMGRLLGGWLTGAGCCVVGDENIGQATIGQKERERGLRGWEVRESERNRVAHPNSLPIFFIGDYGVACFLEGRKGC